MFTRGLKQASMLWWIYKKPNMLLRILALRKLVIIDPFYGQEIANDTAEYVKGYCAQADPDMTCNNVWDQMLMIKINLFDAVSIFKHFSCLAK